MADPKMAEAPAAGKKTLIEDGTEFRGAFTSDCPVVVSGKVNGEVAAPSLTVTRSGMVHGKVRVKDITCEGEVAGEFDAETVRLSGRVNDGTVIRAKSLEVTLAAEKGQLQVTFGECMLEVGDEPKRNQGNAPAPHATAPAPQQPPKPQAQAPQPPKPPNDNKPKP